jgi:hypothetical protein
VQAPNLLQWENRFDYMTPVRWKSGIIARATLSLCCTRACLLAITADSKSEGRTGIPRPPRNGVVGGASEELFPRSDQHLSAPTASSRVCPRSLGDIKPYAARRAFTTWVVLAGKLRAPWGRAGRPTINVEYTATSPVTQCRHRSTRGQFHSIPIPFFPLGRSPLPCSPLARVYK